MSPQPTRHSARKAILGAIVAALLLLTVVPGSAQALPLAPTVSAVSPGSGPSSGGNSVTLTGSGFIGADSVTFGGISASFSAPVFNNTMVVTAPFRGFSTTVHVVVHNTGGYSTQTINDLYTYTNATPVVTSVSPAFGPISGGTLVQVTGSGFTNATVVTFGGVAGTFLSVIDDTRLTVYSPAHLGGGSVFVVVWVNGTPSTGSFASTFTYGGGLTVSSVSPASGPPTGGTIVTITGSGFSGATAVSFGGVFGTILQIPNDFTLIAQTPAHFAGSVHTNVWLGSTPSPSTVADFFLYNGGLTVFDVTPASGPTSGGTAVTINGSGFLDAVAVTFGGSSSVNFVIQNDNEILAVTPPHSAGTVDVVVWNSVTSSNVTGSGLFTYTSAIAVTGISPNSGLASGGQTVTVSGIGFLSATSVAFGTSTASNMHIVSDSQLTVTVPPHAAGAVHVTVFSGDVGSTATSADVFTYTAVPATNPPARFAGRVVINGGTAPNGTGVQAYIGSVLCGSATVFASGGDTRYVVDVASSDSAAGCGSDGAAVTFWVGGFQAQSSTWHNYQLTNLDLAVGSGAVAPPPTVPPTASVSAPLPPNTGSLGASTASSSSSGSWVLFVLLGGAAMVVGTAAMAGMRRRVAPVAIESSGQLMVRAEASAVATTQRRGGGWLAIAGLGAAAVVAGTVIAKRRGK